MRNDHSSGLDIQADVMQRTPRDGEPSTPSMLISLAIGKEKHSKQCVECKDLDSRLS